MTTLPKLMVLFCVLIFFWFSSFAQEADLFQLSLYTNVSIPSAEFSKAVENPIGGVGVGLGGNLLINPMGKRKQSFVFPGIDFSYLTFGRDKIDGSSTSPPYKTTFNYYSVSGQLRFFFTGDREGFAPFVDGMIGLKVVNTRTKIDKSALESALDDDQPVVIHSENDAGLGNAAGLGCYWRKNNTNDEGVRTAKVSFTFRVLYLWGDQTSYVKRGSMEVTDGKVSFESGHTKTNMVMIQIGACLF